VSGDDSTVHGLSFTLILMSPAMLNASLTNQRIRY
jgi:hypothetical protein